MILNITDVTSEGAGVGRCPDGYVVFVPGTAVGDTAEVLLVKPGKDWGYGKLLSVQTPSPDRVPTDCPVYGKCGGCALRHISYEAELQIKKNWVKESFRRTGGFTELSDLPIYSALEGAVDAAPCASAADYGAPYASDRYRNKAEYPAGTGSDGKLHFGMYAQRSHRVIPCEDCLLTPAFYGKIVAATENFCHTYGLAAYDDGENPKGLVRHLYIRDARATGEVSVSLIICADRLPHAAEFVAAVRKACPAAVSVSVIVNKKPGNEILGDKCDILWGKETVTDILCGLKFEISPLSFYQVNRAGAELLYTLAKEKTGLSGKETLLDLYCGAGTIGLSMADRVQKLYGVEIIPAAVENAKKNAARNSIGNAEFFCADAGEAAVRLAAEGVRPDVLVVDPPRKGCNDAVFDAVKAMMPEKITMISCNHNTGARDARRFCDLGYAIDEIFAVDLFPRTAHVETVVLLSKLSEAKHRVTVELKTDELDLTPAEAKASYEEIRDYVKQKYNLTVSHLNIAQVKRKNGIIERENYNLPKSADSKQPNCTPEKEAAITEALEHFQMINVTAREGRFA